MAEYQEWLLEELDRVERPEGAVRRPVPHLVSERHGARPGRPALTQSAGTAGRGTDDRATATDLGAKGLRCSGYKTGGATHDDGRNELRDEIPPDSFVREHLRRLREEETVSWGAVRSRLKL